MEHKKEKLNAVRRQKDKSAYPAQEYIIPKLSEAYHDDDTRNMGYREYRIQKNREKK